MIFLIHDHTETHEEVEGKPYKCMLNFDDCIHKEAME